MSSKEPEEAATSQKQKRPRSPSYPAQGLEACVKWARKMYEVDRKNTMPTMVAIKHCGYSSLSGPSRVALSSLKKFGLLVEDGSERVRLTEEAVRIILTPNETERLGLLRTLAKRCDIIREMLDEYRDGFPSDATLKYKLVADRGFGEEAADTFIAALQETVRFAKLGSEEYQNDVPPEAPVEEHAPPAQWSTQHNAVRAPAAPAAPARSVPGPNAPGRPGGDGASLRWELSDGTWVDLHASASLTAETIDELMEYLRVYEKVLKKRAAAAEAARSTPDAD